MAKSKWSWRDYERLYGGRPNTETEQRMECTGQDDGSRGPLRNAPDVHKPVPLLSAGPCQCRWPLWEPGDGVKLVCGAQTAAGSSYCAEHVRRAFTGSPPLPRRWLYS